MIAASMLLAVSALTVFTPDTVTREAVQRELASLVRVDTVPGPPGEGTVRVVGFNRESRGPLPLLGGFLQEHGGLVWYLATHTPGAGARMITERDDPSAVRDSVVSALRTNERFNARVLAMLAEYWRGRGRAIEGAAPTSRRDSVTLARISTIGARFFFPDRFSSRGDTMFTHICAGINGIADLPEPVDPLLEAFVYVSVSGSVFRPHAPLMSAFEAASKRAKVASASRDASTRVKRAQGALWAELEESPAMREALTKAYAEHRAVLPFRLVAGT